jgi:cytochrome c553
MHAIMCRHSRRTAAPIGILLSLCIGLAVPGPAPRAEPPQRLSYTRDVRPILAAHCFNCHGLDAESRQADLRLDLRESAVAPRDSRPAIVPGKPAAGGVTARIRATDETLVMPPPEFKKPLTPAQVATLERWIAEGATYEPHWAFTAPVRPPVPTVSGGTRNPIDAFVRQRLSGSGLVPAPAANRETWLRRVSLDLTGLPPTPAERGAFLADQAADAFEKVVDRLLASSRHAERMALLWLDAARYADTNGYNNDEERSQWPWRDWVIDAFARNLSYDRFIVEQLAGDLLPDATQAQRIATGFGRNHVLTTEGGIIDEEYRIEYVADRIQTTASAFMAVTLQCARCHDHKFDPISQRDYFGLFAFFNSLPDRPVNYGGAASIRVAEPFIVIRTAADQAEHDRLTGRNAELERAVREAAEPKKPAAAEDAPAAAPQTPSTPAPDALLAAVKNQLAAVDGRAARVMVMADLPAPRPTRLLHRGQYDQPRDTIEPGVPSGFPPLPEGVPRNRLALARWLVDPRHPLTARVAVNRWWEMLFGRGLVATVEDFGTQGEPPSHPELLDWLAVDFVEGGWDVRRILRTIVLSETYRQSSAVPADAFARDPDNRLLARGPRFRLPAEMIRDQALFAAGLLVEQVGGPSVKPYQPAGLWEEVSVEHKARYVPDAGPGLHRRSMYTFWKRTCPPPGMTLFDAPDREVCSVRRPRTTTPLQSLVLMNDPTYVEAARSLAAAAIAAVPADAGQDAHARDASILAEGFRRLLGREPAARERDLLLGRLADFRQRFAADRGAAARLLDVGTVRPPAAIAPDELAAWSTIMSLLLCFDETLTKG